MSEDSIRDDKPGSKVSIIMFFLLVFAVIIVAFLVYLKSNDMDFENINIKEFVIETFYEEKGTKTDNRELLELSYDGKSHPAFCVYKGLIVKSTKDYIKAINKKGEEVWVKSVSLNSPLIKTNGSELLIADLGGRSIYIFKGKDIKWEERTDYDIVNAHISREGYVTVVQKVHGYRNRVKVYDPYGVEMFYRNIAENFVLSAGVSPLGEQVVINSINTSGISVKSKLEFIKVLDENPFAAVLKEDMILPLVQYLDDDSLLAASGSCLFYFDRDRTEVWVKQFKKVYSSSICLGKYIAAAVESENGGGFYGGEKVKVQIYNTKGKQIAGYPIRDKVRNIRSYSNIIAVNTGREVHFIDIKGRLISKAGSKVDILDVYFINKLEAVLVTKNTVKVIRVRG